MKSSTLDNADYAAFAWKRYKTLMIWMALAATVAVIVGLGTVRLTVGPIPGLVMVFVAGGIFFSVLLAAALMGLVFLSSGSGHDEAVDDRSQGDESPR